MCTGECCSVAIWFYVMSFLAQLRERQGVSQQGLKLGYFLRVRRETANAGLADCPLQLTLALVEIRDGLPVGQLIPYRIQRQHMQLPPPFMTADDVEILQQIFEWAQGFEAADKTEFCFDGRNPHVKDIGHFLEMLLGTQRCFIDVQRKAAKFPTPYWQVARLVEPRVGRLAWQDKGDATFRLVWALDRLVEVFLLQDQWLYCSAMGEIGCVVHALSEAAIQAVFAVKTILPVTAVSDFRAVHQAQWRLLNLPVPEAPVCNIESAYVVPVVIFRTIRDTGVAPSDCLELCWRYCCAQYCALVSADSMQPDCGYWDGNVWHGMPRQWALEAQCAQQLTECLAPLGLIPLGQNAPTDSHNTLSAERVIAWQAPEQSSWMLLLTQGRQTLISQGYVCQIERGFRHHYINVDQWHAQLTKMEADAWQLSVQITAEGESIQLNDLLSYLSKMELLSGARTHLIPLESGKVLLLPAEKMNGIMSELGDLIRCGGGGSTVGGVLMAASVSGFQFPVSQLNRLQSLSEVLPEQTKWQGDTELLDQVHHMHASPEELNQACPGLNATLRPYQWLGVCWLQHLKRQNINGLLADDMGLGKTLQTLAHLNLEFHHQGLQEPALIVAPTSVLHNWAAEIRRFVPGVRCLVLHGPGRHQYWEQLQRTPILITSYSLISQDLHHWQKQKLSWLVLDEAQYIKNPRTRNCRSVKQLNSRHRLCLSGTPVENHLGELWSILDFLMPGCLGSERDFDRFFRKPIEQHGDGECFARLLQRVAPFMLRRTKDQVAQDLPKKTEIHQRITMRERQRAWYEHLKTEGWATLQEQLLEHEDRGQSHIFVLTALLKLRQACCDPALLGEHEIHSAKRDHCMKMVQALLDEGRVILIFSQFAKMLQLLAQDLASKEIQYEMLTGQTRNRQTLVDRFQQGEVSVFLISLKAGGVGLNLTRADSVIHYDPWWNSAVEQQATDRVHRIGQDKPVFVYKLIIENSIEDKIVSLQQRKAQLSQHVHAQAQNAAEQFQLTLDELIDLWRDE